MVGAVQGLGSGAGGDQRGGETRGGRNPIRFQEQYFDEETGCIATGIGITTLTAEDSRPATQSNLLEAPNSYEYALNPIQWIDLLGLQRSKGCPNALEDAKREAARLRAIGGKLPTATCAMVNRRTGKIYTGTSETKLKNINGELGVGMPASSLESWGANNCAEIHAENKALKDGSSIVDLDVATVYTRSGEPMPCCKNCSVTFKKFKVLTGNRSWLIN